MSAGEGSEGRERCPMAAEAAPYVLGALADTEPYREHLAGCAACREEVASLQLAVDALGDSVALTQAPPALRERVLSVVRAEAELLHAAGHEADQPRAPRSMRVPRAWRAGLAGALAAGAAVAVTLALSTSSSPRLRVTPAQLASSEPAAHAALRQLGTHAELLVSGMRQPPRGHIYEVWLRGAAGAPRPTDALFGVTNSGSGSVGVPGNLAGVREVLVTSEPLGGSRRPTSSPLIRVVLPL